MDVAVQADGAGARMRRSSRRILFVTLALSGFLFLMALSALRSGAGPLMRIGIWGGFVLSVPVSVLAAQGHWRARRLLEDRDGMIDDLTGLPNRSGIICELDQWRMESGDVGRRAWLVNVALMNLNKLNHEYGYAVGDALVKHVARLLRTRLGGGYAVGRIGPGEFMVALPDADEGEARSVASSLEAEIEAFRQDPSRGEHAAALKVVVSYTPYRPEVEPLRETMKAARESTLAWEFSGSFAENERYCHVPRVTLGAFAARQWDALSEAERSSFGKWSRGLDDEFGLQMAADTVRLLDERAELGTFDFVTHPPADRHSDCRPLARQVARLLGVPCRDLFRARPGGPDDRHVEPILDAAVQAGQSALLVSDVVRSGVLERKCVRQMSGRGVHVLSISWAAQ